MTSRTAIIFLFVSLFVLIAPQLYGQTESVFYRIEGKGIKPLYVFGVAPSAHELTYATGDSVFIALAQSEALVSIFYPDSANEEELLLKDEIKISKLINSTKFGRADELFEQWQNQSLRKYDSYQPLFIRDLLANAMYKKIVGSSVKDFVEMLADEQGIQNIRLTGFPQLPSAYSNIPLATQADILIDFVMQSGSLEKNYQRLTGQYLAGRPGNMAMIQKTAYHYEYSRQVCRFWVNHLLACIDQNAFDRSLFVMVDGSLLGGKEGLISSLVDHGFTASPVQTDFSVLYRSKGSADIYLNSDSIVFKEQEGIDYYNLNLQYDEQYISSIIPNWYTTTSFGGTFSVRTPEPPTLETEQVPLDFGSMKVYLYKYDDKAINSFYVVSFNDYPPYFRESIEGDFFRHVVSRSVEKLGGTLLLEKDISTHEFEGREIEVLAEREFVIRARFYLVGNRMYQVMLGATKDRAYTEENEAYFKSFRLINDRENKWFRLQLGHASVELPAEPTVQQTAVNSIHGQVHTFSYETSGRQTNLDYLLNLSHYPDGFKIKNEDVFYRSLLYKLADRVSGVLIKEEDIKFNKFKGKYIEMGSGTDVLYRGYFLYADNRLYQVMVRGPEDSAYSNFAEKFLRSFHLSALEY